MNLTATAHAIVAGLKTFASGDARTAFEAVDHGLDTVDHALRVANLGLDTIERGLGIGRDVLAAFHQTADAKASAPAAAHTEKTAAERGDELLRAAKEEYDFNRMLALHQAGQRRVQALVGLSQDCMDAADKLRRGSNARRFAGR